MALYMIQKSRLTLHTKVYHLTNHLSIILYIFQRTCPMFLCTLHKAVIQHYFHGLITVITIQQRSNYIISCHFVIKVHNNQRTTKLQLIKIILRPVLAFSISKMKL